jgi:adenosylcobyric acid synthase
MGETNFSGPIISANQVYGTYIHGLFDSDNLRHNFIDFARQACNLPPAQTYADVAAEREARIDRWANHVRHSLDMKLIRHLAGVA